MNLINKTNYKYRIMQVFILCAHLVLLKWILYTLAEGGVLPFNTLLFHFLGISAAGATLIRFCAWFYHRRYIKQGGTIHGN